VRYPKRADQGGQPPHRAPGRRDQPNRGHRQSEGEHGERRAARAEPFITGVPLRTPSRKNVGTAATTTRGATSGAEALGAAAHTLGGPSDLVNQCHRHCHHVLVAALGGRGAGFPPTRR
jgi:hypothetical protein